MQVTLFDGTLFRPMTAADVAQVAEMEKICFRSPWSKRMLRAELDNAAAHYHVLQSGDALIAYAGMWVLFEEAHITNIAVLPAYRRKGYGKLLMLLSMCAALELNASEMTLEVRESNMAAQAMYAQLNFLQNGRRKRYYVDTGEDALILWNRDIAATVRQLQA